MQKGAKQYDEACVSGRDGPWRAGGRRHRYGGDRQELHEKLRVHSQAAAAVVKGEGKPNDLLERIAADPAFGLTLSQLQEVMDARLYIGRCPNQVVEFIQEQVLPRLSGAAQGPIGQIRV